MPGSVASGTPVISLNSSYNERCFRQNLLRKSKHNLCSVIPSPRKSCRLSDVEKYGGDKLATDEHMVHAHSVLGT